MSEDRAQFDRLLDEHLAGSLQGDDLRRFGAMLEAHPELRAEAELHRTIAGALREQMKAPVDFAARAREMALSTHDSAVTPISAASLRKGGRDASRWTRRIAIAAVLLIGVFGAWSTWRYVSPQPRPYPDTGQRRSPETAYYEIIATGFEPAWVCKNDQEFLDNVRKSLGTEFVIDQRDPGVRVVGLAYANTISPWTVMILSYVNEQPVVVFADRQLADRELPEPTSPTLTWHKREFGDIVLYELTPFDEPMILPRVHEPAEGSGPSST